MGSKTHLLVNLVTVVLLLAAAFLQAAALDQLEGRKLAAATLQACLASGGARTAFPGTAEYTNARTVYNLRQKFAPAAFVFPTTVAHVQNAVLCSKQVGVGIAPRGGGHSYEDYSLGGRDGVLVVDMTGFTQLTYNKASKTAVIGSGWRLGPLYLALWNAGKVTLPAGSCVTLGLAGHALGGGWGFSSRKFGLVSDNIIEAQLVTANGTLVTANVKQNPDLYFALRGAGANSYGIVTQFTFRMNDVSAPVTHFKYSWSNKALQFQNFKAFQTWGATVLSEVSASFYLDPSGQSSLEGTFLGPQTGLTPLVKGFLAAAGPAPTTSVEQLSWIQLVLVNAGFKATADPAAALKSPPLPTSTFKAKSIYVGAPGLSDAGINAMLNAMRAGPNGNAYFLYDLYGAQSVINKVARDSTAFVHRGALFSIQMVAYWGNNAGEAAGDTTFIRNYWNAVRPYATGEAYQNYIDRDMPLAAYYGSNLNALIVDKRKWDPQNVFNFPQSIPLK